MQNKSTCCNAQLLPPTQKKTAVRNGFLRCHYHCASVNIAEHDIVSVLPSSEWPYSYIYCGVTKASQYADKQKISCVFKNKGPGDQIRCRRREVVLMMCLGVTHGHIAFIFFSVETSPQTNRPRQQPPPPVPREPLPLYRLSTQCTPHPGERPHPKGKGA